MLQRWISKFDRVLPSIRATPALVAGWRGTWNRGSVSLGDRRGLMTDRRSSLSTLWGGWRQLGALDERAGSALGVLGRNGLGGGRALFLDRLRHPGGGDKPGRLCAVQKRGMGNVVSKNIRKRFKITAGGKIYRLRAGMKRKLMSKPGRKKRRMRGWHPVAHNDIPRVRRMLKVSGVGPWKRLKRLCAF